MDPRTILETDETTGKVTCGYCGADLDFLCSGADEQQMYQFTPELSRLTIKNDDTRQTVHQCGERHLKAVE